jgi:hypothetical protein
MKGSSYLCAQITSGFENSVLLHVDITPPEEEVLIYPLKLFRRNSCNFPTNIFFSFLFPSGVIVVNFVLQTTPEEKNHKD